MHEAAETHSDLGGIYQNVRGLRSKVVRISDHVKRSNMTEHFYALVETWLTEDIASEELFGSNYHVFRCDRNRELSNRKDGGGVLLAVRNDLRSVLISSNSRSLGDVVDAVFVQVCVPNSVKINIAVCMPHPT